MRRKCCFEIGHGDGWCDFEFPVAIRRRGEVVGWAGEGTDAAILAYTVNTRRERGRYLPPILERLAGGGRCGEDGPPRVEVDGSGRHGGVAGCGVAVTCNGRVLAWMKHSRHARFIAAAVNRAAA